MKKENTEDLQWFVEFANMALETIKPGDKAKLLIEAEEYLWPKKELEELNSFLAPDSLSTEVMSRFTEWGNIPDRESKEYWTVIVRSQEKVRHIFLDTVYDIGISRGWSIAGGGQGQELRMGKGMMLWWVVKGQKMPYKLKLLPLTESQEDYLNLKILSFLDGFPGHAIRRCPGCKRFFLNPTGKEKRFCGERCMRRIATARYREANKEKNNDYQNKLMNDRLRESKGLKRIHTKKREPKDQGEPLKPKATRLSTKKGKRKEG